MKYDSERRFFTQFVGTEEPPVEELLPPGEKPTGAAGTWVHTPTARPFGALAILHFFVRPFFRFAWAASRSL
jgi:hypothetical protein